MTGDERAARVTRDARIQVECLACGRASTLDRPDEASPSLVQLTRRLRCSACGSRAVKAFRIETPRDVARLIRARMTAADSG